jgi:hypothetical protein
MEIQTRRYVKTDRLGRKITQGKYKPYICIERWEERPEVEFFNVIFSQGFWAYKLESSQTRALSGFLPSFFLKWYS